MEAVISSGILKSVVFKLAQQVSLVNDTTDVLQELNIVLENVNSWLDSLENKASETAFIRLKDVAYDIDSLVDEFKLMTQKHEATSGVISKSICTILESFIFRIKVKEIKKRISKVVKEITDITAIASSLPLGHPVDNVIYKKTGETTLSPIVDERFSFGRTKEKHLIISKLVETNDRHNMNIVSIVGLGGLGKTMLAKLVFQDRCIKENFDVTLWVHASQEFDVQKLIKKLFEAIANEISEHQLQHMCTTISNILSGKRCLIVLDDVWVEDGSLWDQFMTLVNISATGSRILLTTRSTRVAEAVESTYMFCLPFLSEDESWDLFQHSFGEIEELASEFLDVGRDIVCKCGGVPLAIKAVAGVLRDKRHIEQWYNIRDHDLNDVVGLEKSIFGCLMLSYFHMPSNLKKCFAICSVFPKGYIFDKENLIDLWIAHDMIPPENRVEYLDHIGHRYFNFLLQMSFLQVVSERYGRLTCTMHYLVHDLARVIMREEISLVSEVATSSNKTYRYFSITKKPSNLPSKNLFKEARSIYVAEGDYFTFDKALKNAKHLRSITVKYTKSVPKTIFQVKNLMYLEISGLKCEVLPQAISDIWSLQALQVTECDILKLPKSIGNLQKLRTLNLSLCERLKCLPGSVSNCHMLSNLDLSGCIEFEVFPDSIGTNKRLRVLRISHTKIKRLPSSVMSLENLECLDLQQCPELLELPEGLENLKKLEVLNLEGCPKLRAMVVGTGQVRQQQNLNILITGEIRKSAKISELRDISGVTYVIKPGDQQNACLKEKTALQRLRLHWGRNDAPKEANLEAVFDGLEAPSGIKELHVGGYAGCRYAQWMLKQVDNRVQWPSQFPFLTVMTLCGLPNIKHLDGLMGLPCLEKLDLRWIPSLKSISGGPFPSLKKLRMEGLCSLEEVLMVTEGNLADGEEGQMQIGICLSEIHIEECPNLKVKPYFPSSLERLVLHRSNEQLLLPPGQSQEPSSSSSYSYNHLKKLELWGMAASSSPQPSSGSKLGWDLLQHMKALESLMICRCDLTKLPESIRSLTSLRSLSISLCCAIGMLPDWLGELHSLQEMTIQSCHSLSGLPQSIGHLASLRELRIERCDELHQLPECLGELRSLRKFSIASLQGLTCLPMSMCRFLEELEISDCPGLTSLPEWIRGLHTLKDLKITRCPDLERHCERVKGEDWHLIEHIPHLQIGLDEEEPAS